MQLVSNAGWIATSFRTIAPFRLYQPRSVAEVANILTSEERAPTLLAGGTDLCAQFNEGLSPQVVVSLKKIEALRQILVEDGCLSIGACVTHGAGSANELVRARLPGFADAWRQIANVRIRMVASLGGNLMAARARYEAPILIAALGATLRFHDSNSGGGRRLLEAIDVPLRDERFFYYDRSLRPVMTVAVCIERARAGEGLSGRVVVGTEYCAPVTLDLDLDGCAAIPDCPSRAHDIAERSFAKLPADFADEVTSNRYLRHAGRVLLARALTGAQ